MDLRGAPSANRCDLTHSLPEFLEEFDELKKRNGWRHNSGGRRFAITFPKLTAKAYDVGCRQQIQLA
ncbi:hypothetical protein LB542_19005 [Mesorhizobium sp. BR1-1-9]|uniref:hypothetical protein n=1 Tax=unclassified Mesorhizobium TaxID=325217 RepID=UPI001CD04B30|nr:MULTISPECIES: hypothetical protein [unclassified Mesorhizobium]MBZ9872940.1 hypothetical protein [Mesorhizobium sp. BR1-1-9]MBZ9944091.1 hypothetical protein [Mesorhizobium sp. BR1-1-13]